MGSPFGRRLIYALAVRYRSAQSMPRWIAWRQKGTSGLDEVTPRLNVADV